MRPLRFPFTLLQVLLWGTALGAPGPLGPMAAVLALGTAVVPWVRATHCPLQGAALAVPLGLAGWTLLGCLPGTSGTGGLIGWSAALGCLLAAWWREWRRGPLRFRRGRGAAGPLAVGFAVAAFAAVVWWFNAPSPRTGDLTVRSWAGLDTMYFAALAESAARSGGWPISNPFLSGAGNHYPSGLHLAVAAVACATRGDVLATVWAVGPLAGWSAGTLVALLVRMSCSGAGRCAWRALAAALLALSLVAWHLDFFVYPATQTFALPVLLAILWLCRRNGDRRIGPRRTVLWALAGVLCVSHTITGSGVLLVLGARMLAGLAAARGRGAMFAEAPLIVVCAALLWTASHRPVPLEQVAGLPRLPLTMETARYGWRLFHRPLAVILAAVCFGAAARSTRRYLLPCLGMLMAGTLAVHVHALRLVNDAYFAAINAERLLYLAGILGLCLGSAPGRRVLPGMAIAVAAWTVVFPPVNLVDARALFAGPSYGISGDSQRAIRRGMSQSPTPGVLLAQSAPAVLAWAAATPVLWVPGPNNLWGAGTVTHEDYTARQRDHAAFFRPGATPAERARILRTWGVTAVFHDPPGGDDAGSSATVARLYPAGTARVVWTGAEGVLVLVNGAGEATRDDSHAPAHPGR